MSNLVATGLTSVLGAAGQAVVVAVGPCAGGYLVNPLAALSQGIPTPEELYVYPVGGRYREGTRSELIEFLIRNCYA